MLIFLFAGFGRWVIRCTMQIFSEGQYTGDEIPWA
jgi:hypothetical protein